MQEIRGAVERIDDPAVLRIAALRLARFLHQEAVGGTRLLKLGADDLLGAVIGGGDEVRRPLARDLQVLHLAEVALQSARRLGRGATMTFRIAERAMRAAYSARRT